MAGEWKQHGPQSLKGLKAIIKLEAKRLPILCESDWQHHIKLWSRSMCTKNKFRCPNLLELMKATVGTRDGVQGELMWATVRTCDGGRVGFPVNMKVYNWCVKPMLL